MTLVETPLKAKLTVRRAYSLASVIFRKIEWTSSRDANLRQRCSSSAYWAILAFSQTCFYKPANNRLHSPFHCSLASPMWLLSTIIAILHTKTLSWWGQWFLVPCRYAAPFFLKSIWSPHVTRFPVLYQRILMRPQCPLVEARKASPQSNQVSFTINLLIYLAGDVLTRSWKPAGASLLPVPPVKRHSLITRGTPSLNSDKHLGD